VQVENGRVLVDAGRGAAGEAGRRVAVESNKDEEA
jgi:hypothetical protein